MTSETATKSQAAVKAPSKKKDLASPEMAAKCQSLVKPLLNILYQVIPFCIKAGRLIHMVWSQLDQDLIDSIVGFVFCFFGGLYPTLFSAIQAAEYGGRAKVVEALGDLAEEATKIIEQSRKDDKVDADGNGKADVDELSSRAYVERKTLLVLSKMDPKKVDNAMSSIYSVWMCVMAVLSIQFARTIQMAHSIAEFMEQPVNRFIAPVIMAATPDKYDKWVPVILGWVCKSVGMSLAWTIATIQIAFASAMKGGLVLSRSLYKELLKRNIRLNGLIVDNHADTSIDEYASYVFAALGFMFQLFMGFEAPFPLNVVLWPFQFAEWFIRISLMKASGK